MYLPAHFKEERLDVLHGLMRAHPLAALVTVGPHGTVADHLPLEIDASASPLGTLRGHFARANPAWREHPAGTKVLAIFQGPQAYVSPSWYPGKQRDSRVVPTWNYVIAHAYGPLRVIEDAAWLRALVGRLTTEHEATRPSPWKVEDAPTDYIDRMLNAIVGFEIPIVRIEGKWKLSQNRSAEDRTGVAQGLEATAAQVARLMLDIEAGNR